MQSMPVEPLTVGFVTDEQKNYFIDYDPERAKQLLAEMGLTDANGDGILERPTESRSLSGCSTPTRAPRYGCMS
jgi:ABC-type transport system substrate-binding protein